MSLPEGFLAACRPFTVSWIAAINGLHYLFFHCSLPPPALPPQQFAQSSSRHECKRLVLWQTLLQKTISEPPLQAALARD